MPFTKIDQFTMSRLLDGFAVPMFMAERDHRADTFRLICVNAAHTAKTGLQTKDIRNKRPSDFLNPKDAAAVQNNYMTCANGKGPTRYQERLFINGTPTEWDTTLQCYTLPDGRERIIGTAIAIDRGPICEHLDDAAYYSAVAQMQLGKLRQFLRVLENRRDVPGDITNMAAMVGNMTQSIDAVLDDIRTLSEPSKRALTMASVSGQKALR